MLQDEERTIETFCAELSLALRQITGKTICIQPEWLAAPDEEAQQPDETRTPSSDLNDAQL